jgi:membrane peptidoglycan carboxypeptidase
VTVRRVVSAETARAVTSLLESVVSEGTGANARVPGYRVAGKTSTAQRVSEGGGYDPDNHVSSFIGFLPADRPELLCLVIVDSPQGVQWGSQVAAPVFNRIMRRILSLRGTPVRHRVASISAPQTSGRSPLIRPAAYRLDQGESAVRRRADGRLEMPDLLGVPMRGAVTRLSGAGLRVRVDGSGWVVGQVPSPGTPVPAGTTCRVVCKTAG